MSQQWEYRSTCLVANRVLDVNDALRDWAADGWELVNGSYGVTATGGVMWLFWRRARSSHRGLTTTIDHNATEKGPTSSDRRNDVWTVGRHEPTT
jgi:hypothetical protein